MTTATYPELIAQQSVSVDGWTAWDYHLAPAPDADGNVWVWETIKGWFGALSVRANPIDRPMLDGVYDGPSVFGGRTIELSGSLISPTRYALQRGMDVFAGVLAGAARQGDLVVNEAQQNLVRTSAVRLGGPSLIERTGACLATWSLNLFAPDPRRYSSAWKTLSTLPGAEGQGRIYDLTFDRKYGAIGSDGWLHIYNAGGTSTSPIITFYGPSTNPYMQQVGGTRVALSTTLAANERMVLDCFNRTCLLYNQPQDVNGVNRRFTMTPDSRWLTLPPGYSDVFYGVSAGNGLGSIKWRDAWL